MTSPTAEVDHLRASRAAVLERIAGACGRVGRDPSSIQLIAVSKTVPAERLRSAVAAGLTALAENRVQEAESKVGVVDGATWDLVGPLQSNKARKAVEVAAVIESVDSVELGRRLDRLVREVRGLPVRRLPIYLQVNVDDDPSKFGFAPAELERALDDLAGLEAVEIAGLMTIGKLVESAEAARPTFVGLRRLSERLRARSDALGPGLSMGMTDDYPIAVEEGATVVRVGRAIFGERPRP